jgi:hypothetical protein
MRTIRLLVALPAGLALIATAALAGCTSGGTSSSAASGAVGAPGGAVASPAQAPAAKGIASSAGGASSVNGARSAAGGADGNGQAASAARLSPAGQQLIYTAQLTVRASDVSAAVSRATAIAADAGGYVASENASSNPDHPDQSTATIEVKIPVTAYAVTLGELSGSALGTRLSLQQQAQDVTQQVADVNSRVASDEAAISQLRSLLSHAGSVGDLLDVQNQINSQESDLEALQAQQSALNHETAFATVAITIVGPKAPVKPKSKPAPPPGLAAGLSGGWHALRVTVSWVLAILGAVAPFAAVVAVAGFAAFRVRRWLMARTRGPRAEGSPGGGADG